MTSDKGYYVTFGRILQRNNRFSVEVLINSKKELAYLPNPGRLPQLLLPGMRACLVPNRGKFKYKLVAVKLPNFWVSVDSLLVNKFFKESVQKNILPGFKDFRILQTEPRFQNSRFDFLLESPSGIKAIVEVKSCTLVQNKTALFPDAPTARGERHLKDLMDFLKFGEAYFIVVAQRPDARRFEPNWAIQPSFVKKFKEALEKGVKALLIVTRWKPSNPFSLELINTYPVLKTPDK